MIPQARARIIEAMNETLQVPTMIERQRKGSLAVTRGHLRKTASAPASGSVAIAAQPVVRNTSLEARIAELQRERVELRDALAEAAQVQRALYAPRQLRRGSFEIASEVFPLRYLSGDFYDVLDLGAALALVVGDIAGKGLAAGQWFTHFLGAVRVHAGSHEDPAAAVATMNRQLWEVSPTPPMASLFLARLDSQSGELAYCNAGQPAALLVRCDGRVDALREGGPVVGALPEAFYKCGRAALEPGDTLIGYSDGIVERRNCREEEFGVTRLLEAARSARDSSSSAVLFSILGAVQDFAAGHPPQDDFTLMVVRRLEAQPRK